MNKMNFNYESVIVERNRDVEHIVNAATYTGMYGLGVTQPKRFGLLVSADIHRCGKQLRSAIEYLNAMVALDAGICLGDIQGANFTENDGSWYYLTVNESLKPFYTVIGNHDGGHGTKKEICGSKEEVFEKFVASTRETMRMPELDKTYYSVNFDEYKITLIVLDNYMAPGNRDEEGDFVIGRGAECIDQAEVDWLVRTLENIPKDYHVLIARHGYPDSAEIIPGSWTDKNGIIFTEEALYGKCELVPDIVNAWIKGESLEKYYEPVAKKELLPVLSVKADFSKRGEGVFVGYLTGHVHRDIIGRSAVYHEQNIICFASSANDDWQSHGVDLLRLRGTKAEDCLTVLAVDRNKRCLHLVRVGSNYTSDLIERTHTTITY